VRLRRRIAYAAALLAVVVLCIPAVPSLVASVSGLSTVTNGGATAGHVTVTGCRSTLLGITASCHGTFGYADPGGAVGAQPSEAVADVTIANDPRHHRAGDTVDVSLVRGTHRAYVSSSVQTLCVLAQVVGIFVAVALMVAMFVRRTDGGRPVMAYAAMGVSVAVLVATWLLLPTPPPPLRGPVPPTAAVGSP
jgi:hypothetical protein